MKVSSHLEPRYSLPSWRLLSENIIPAMYAKVKDKQKVCLGKAKSISFTTDNWTEPCTTKAFIGMSAHWVDTRWQRKSAILNCEQSSGRHTTERIAAKFEPVKYN